MIGLATVIDLCKYGISLFKNNQSDSKEERLRISSVLNDIGSILNDTADKLSLDIYPSDNCIIMERLVSQLLPKILPYIEDEDAERLMGALNEVVYLEKLYVKRKEDDIIPSIKEASGEFKAMSLLLKF